MNIKTVEHKIFEVRGHKIILDFALAEMYETETKYLKRAVKNNLERFPLDFMFEITKEEWDFLRCNFSTLKNSARGKHPKYLPYAFTEQGVAMLSSVLNSPKAIAINIDIIRAFVMIRQYALTYKELTDRLKSIEGKFTDVYEAINYLLEKDKKEIDQSNRVKIGYKTKTSSKV